MYVCSQRSISKIDDGVCQQTTFDAIDVEALAQPIPLSVKVINFVVAVWSFVSRRDPANLQEPSDIMKNWSSHTFANTLVV